MGGFFAFLLSRATGISAFAILEAGYLLFGLVGLSVVAGGTARELAGRPERRRYLIVLVAGLPLGLVGARLIPVIQDAVAAGRLTWGLVTSGGLVFYGGALVWLAAMALGCRLWRLSPWPLLDAVCHFGPLGHAFGRLGCFFGGCCFGAPTDGPLGVRFPAGSPAFLQHKAQGLLPDGATTSLPVHPTQLYEAVGNLLLFVLLDRTTRHRPAKPGRITGLYLTGYAVLRFSLEFWRGDSIRGIYLGFSTSQYLAVAVALCGLFLLLHPEKRV